MPVIGGGNDDRVDGLIVERPAEIARDLRCSALNLFHVLLVWCQQRFVNVAQIGDLAIRPRSEFLGEMTAPTVNADNSKSHSVVYRHGMSASAERHGSHTGGQADADGPGGFQEFSAAHFIHRDGLQMDAPNFSDITSGR